MDGEQELSSSWDGRPFHHNRRGQKSGDCCAPFGGGRLDTHLTKCRLCRGLPPYQVASSSIQPFGHNTHGSRIIWKHAKPARGHHVHTRIGKVYFNCYVENRGVCPCLSLAQQCQFLLTYLLILGSTFLKRKFNFENNLQVKQHNFHRRCPIILNKNFVWGPCGGRLGDDMDAPWFF